MLSFYDIGIDLGTTCVLIYIVGRGVVLKEPSVAAVDRNTQKILAVGEEARLMLGKMPENIEAVHPVSRGVITNYDVIEKMLRYFIAKAIGRKTLRKPRVCISVPSGISEEEKRVVVNAAFGAGARDVSAIEEPVAAALGAGIDIEKPRGNMVADIGGGTTDIAVITENRTVASSSLFMAGGDFDTALVRYMRRAHNLLIGERTAEEIKINIGTVTERPEPLTMEVRGRNLATGLPKTVVITSEETAEALREPVSEIAREIREVLDETDPGLAADIRERGLVLSGGGSLLFGLPDLLREKTGIPVIPADDPLTAVCVGTGKYMEMNAH